VNSQEWSPVIDLWWNIQSGMLKAIGEEIELLSLPRILKLGGDIALQE
jgi:hypothetical protein